MRRLGSRVIGGVIAVAVVFVGIGVDGRIPQAIGLTSSNGSRILLDRPEIDLGRLVIGQVAKETVRVTNVGANPVTIDDLAGGCSCIAQTYDPKPISSGESRDIIVELDTGPLAPGPVERTVAFKVNGLSQNEYAINLKAYLESEFDVQPTRIELGTALGSSGLSREIGVSAKRAGVTFQHVTTTNEAVEISLIRREGDRLSLVVALRPKSRLGDHYGVLRIETSSEFNPQIRIPIFATVSTQ